MKLSFDLYYDVIQEVVGLIKEDSKVMSRLIFSGNESRIVLKSYIKKINFIYYWDYKNSDNSEHNHH